MKTSKLLGIAAGAALAGFSIPAMAAPVLITDISTDTVQDPAGFPPGADGEWTRFGGAFNTLLFDTDPANVAVGSQSVQTASDWGAGAFYGIRYNIPGAGTDVSSGPVISFQAKYDGAGDPRVEIAFQETDGDIWVVGNVELSTGFETYYVDLADATIADASGGGDLDFNLDQIGFNLLANGSSGVSEFWIDDINWNAEAPGAYEPPPGGLLITDVEADTIDDPPGFPPGVPAEWTRFGVPFADLGITTNPAEVFEGSQSLYAVADWAEGGWGFGIRYNVGTLDASAGPVVSFQARGTDVGTTVTQFNFLQADTSVWAVGSLDLTEDWTEYRVDLSDAVRTDGPDNPLDLSAIEQIGFVFLRSGQDTGTPVFFFDEIYYNVEEDDPGPVDPPVMPVVTSMELPDFSNAGFPEGDIGEWTRFGFAYDSIALVDNASLASDGDKFLRVGASWAAGDRVGARYRPYVDNSDWSSYTAISYDIRSNAVNPASTAQFVFFEADGDVWVGPSLPVSDTWTTETLEFAEDFALEGTDGDGNLDLSSITLLGLNFDNTTFDGGQLFEVDYIRVETATSVRDWTLY